MSSMIARIEQALVARLSALTSESAGYALNVSHDGGPLSADALEEALTLPLPLARVSFIEAVADGGTPANPRLTASFRVDLLTRGTRTPAAARHGVGDRIGAWQLLTDVTALLTGSALGLPISPCQVAALRTAQGAALHRQRLALVTLDLSTSFAEAARPLPDEGHPGEFLALHVEWTGRDEADTGSVPHPDPAQTTPQLIEVRP